MKVHNVNKSKSFPIDSAIISFSAAFYASIYLIEREVSIVNNFVAIHEPTMSPQRAWVQAQQQYLFFLDKTPIYLDERSPFTPDKAMSKARYYKLEAHQVAVVPVYETYGATKEVNVILPLGSTPHEAKIAALKQSSIFDWMLDSNISVGLVSQNENKELWSVKQIKSGYVYFLMAWVLSPR